MKSSSIVEAIGNTPLVRLDRLFRDCGAEVFAKLEMANPAGSSKDRSAANMIDVALRTGQLRPGSTVIESSSGNMAIGLAQACKYHGLRAICVVDPLTSRLNLEILRVYGAEIVEVVPSDGQDRLQARLAKVRELRTAQPECLWINQYENLANSAAHQQTMNEIVADLKAAPDVVFCAVGTFGTIRGLREYLVRHRLGTRLIAVDAKGSQIFGKREPVERRIPGHGSARRPELWSDDIADEVVYVDDVDCVAGCRHLLNEEAILAGGSSGGVITAALRDLPALRNGQLCVLILADRGERYLDTVYSDAWVEEHLRQAD